MKTASWVVIDRKTGKALFETFKQPRYNPDFYRVIPILEYLTDLNRQIKENT
jgi:hypothetical protein